MLTKERRHNFSCIFTGFPTHTVKMQGASLTYVCLWLWICVYGGAGGGAGVHVLTWCHCRVEHLEASNNSDCNDAFSLSRLTRASGLWNLDIVL